MSGIDIQVAGVILLVVGVIGLFASLVLWSSWGGFGNREAAAGGSQNTTIVDRDRAYHERWASSAGSCWVSAPG